MNKILKVILAILLINSTVKAQNKDLSKFPLKQVKIGDTISDVIINNLNNYTTSAIKMSDLKGKLVILDFWATWCAPCLSMFPLIAEMENKYRNKIVIIKVAYEPLDKVSAFLDKYAGGKYSKQLYLADDQMLTKLFPHHTLPHLVWIDKIGVVSAYTGGDEFTEKNINSFLSNEKPILSMKVDKNNEPYDFRYPYFEQNKNIRESNNGRFEKFRSGFRSQFYVGDYSPECKSLQRITTVNMGLVMLYSMAWGKNQVNYSSKSRLQLNVADSSRFFNSSSGIELENWMQNGNAFSYEIVFDKGKLDFAFSKMQNMLDSLIPQYEAKTELQNKLCWVLKRTDSTKSTINLRSGGGKALRDMSFTGAKLRNLPFWQFADQLTFYYFQNNDLPVIDETNITFPVDMDIDAPLSNIEKLNIALKAYGLSFIKEKRIVPILTIKDRKLH